MDRVERGAVFFGSALLDALSATARSTPRGRINHNFHEGGAHPAQRFLNAVEPESYIRPHRHRQATKDETFIVVRGAFGLVLFEEDGTISRSVLLRPGSDVLGAHVPAGVFHALVALERGSVFFEVKAGPYDARSDKEWGPWSPAEGELEATRYLERLRALFA